MFKLIISFCFAVLLIGCKAQNMTSLIEVCKNDVEIWQNEAWKWRNNYIGFIISSVIIWVVVSVAVFCWWRKNPIDSRKRRGY